MSLATSSRIPEAAIRRLPVYLRVLDELQQADVEIVSSAELAVRTGFSPEQIRKDLAYFGAFGTRGVGYETAALGQEIRRILGLSAGVRAALVGAGHLGTALARHSLAKDKGVRIVAIFDNDPAKFGRNIDGVIVRPLADLAAAGRRLDVQIGILTVPATAAQAVAEQLVAAGCEALLNFSPVKLDVPPHVFVQNIDLTMELQSLAYYTSVRREPETEADKPE